MGCRGSHFKEYANMKRRANKKLHTKYIADVVYEVSISPDWRKRLFDSEKDQSFLIDATTENLPTYLRKRIVGHHLRYDVKIVEARIELFDPSLIIFEFSPQGYPETKRYSANSSHV